MRQGGLGPRAGKERDLCLRESVSGARVGRERDLIFRCTRLSPAVKSLPHAGRPPWFPTRRSLAASSPSSASPTPPPLPAPILAPSSARSRPS